MVARWLGVQAALQAQVSASEARAEQAEAFAKLQSKDTQRLAALQRQLDELSGATAAAEATLADAENRAQTAAVSQELAVAEAARSKVMETEARGRQREAESLAEGL